MSTPKRAMGSETKVKQIWMLSRNKSGRAFARADTSSSMGMQLLLLTALAVSCVFVQSWVEKEPTVS